MVLRTYLNMCAVAGAISASAATATTIEFDVYRGWTSGTNTYTSTDNSVSVSVDGVRVNNDGTVTNTSDFYTASWGSSNWGGLSVYDCRNTNRYGYCNWDDYRIDGAGPDEFALLDFGGLTVEITSATFTHWDGRDTFAYGTYDSTDIPAAALIYQDNLGDGSSNPYTHVFGDGELVGSVIGFGADSWRDDFRLQSITFDVVSAVPLPAGGLLILTGLGGLALMRRRRKAA